MKPALSTFEQLFFFIFLILTAPLCASETFLHAPGHSDNLDNTNSFARCAGMGSAFVGVADDATALFTNPAGLAYLGQGQLLVNNDFWLVDTLQETVLFGVPGPFSGSGLALAGNYLGYGTLEGRDNSGSVAPNYGADRIGFDLGAGLEILKDGSVGIGLRGSQTSIASSTNLDLSMSFGVLLKPFPGFRVGASYENLSFSPDPT